MGRNAAPGTGTDLDANLIPYGGNAIVRFERVQKWYDGTLLVVKDLDLEARRGELMSPLGPPKPDFALPNLAFIPNLI